MSAVPSPVRVPTLLLLAALAPWAPARALAQAGPSSQPSPETEQARRERIEKALDDPSLAPPDASEGRAEAERSFGWEAFQMFVVLGIVIALIYLTLNFGLRRMMGLRPAAGVRVVDVVERVPLDQRRALFVVKAAGEYLLVGAAEGGLNLIAKLDREEVERLTRERAAAPSLASPFLQKLLTRRGGPPPPTG